MALRVGAALVLVLICASDALADKDPLAKPSNLRAAEHLTTGNRHYRVREFERAIEEFKAGALIEDAPIFLYNLGQAYRQLGKYEDAIWHYERFVNRTHPTGQLKEAIDKFLVDMRAELAKRTPDPPPTNATTPAESMPRPGPDPAPAATPIPIAPPEGRSGLSTRRKISIGVAAGSLAAVGVGVILGVRANGFEDDAKQLCPMMTCDRAGEANDLLERGQTSATYANVAFGVGAAAAIGAAVLWFTGANAGTQTAVVPHVSGSSAGLGVTTRF